MMRKVYQICSPMLLLIYFALGLTQVTHASITFDEGPHLAIGYTTLRTGELRLQPVHIHPPLANVLAAAPLLLQDDLPDPRDVDGWEIDSLSAITDAVVWQYPEPARIATAGRLPILLIGVLLGALVYRWASDLGGRKAGLLALTLFAFDPNMIAHGSLVTTDMVAVFFIVATLYAVTSEQGLVISEQLSVSRLLVIGFLLGSAQLTKVSALILVPVVGLLLLLREYRAISERQPAVASNQRISESTNLASRSSAQPPCGTHQCAASLWDVSRAWAIVFLTAALVVWAGYGFEIAAVPGLPFKLPAVTHARIFQSLGEHYDLGHPTFLMGRVSNHGWWWYFPVAFVLKTPLPILILAVWSLLNSVVKIQNPKSKIQNLTLWLFPLLYAAFSLFSTVNIGYRHLLPLLPFLYIGIGQMRGEKLVSQRVSESADRRITNYELRIENQVSSIQLPASSFTYHVLLIWLTLGTLTLAPHHLTFFNELAGGAENGYRYFVDSNLDWGQNLWDLRRWMDEYDEDHVYYAHYSPARPDVYGINADFLPPDPRAVDFVPWNPAPGLYAIGVTVLQGPYSPDVNTYAWFRAREPVARLGNALWLYRVSIREAVTWAAICADVTLSPETVRANLRRDNVRIIRPDCAQAFVYPATAQGLIITGPNDAQPLNTQLELTERASTGATTNVVYRVMGSSTPASVVANVDIDGPLDFLGYALDAGDVPPGDDVILQTYWRVVGVPDRPLSLLAHLIGPDGTGIAVGDGLGFPIEQWQPGDVIVQRHVLAIPPDAPSGTYTVITGAYWLDTMARWTTEDGASHIVVEGIEVAQ